MLELGIRLLIAYLLGSLNGALLLGVLRGVDIRDSGSGNAGGTNALRTQGLPFALLVVIIDVGKGLLAVTVIAGLTLPGLTPDASVPAGWIAPMCGAAAIAGHVYPAWFAQRGGKGAGTLVGAYAGLQPLLLVPLFVAWFASMAFTGYVGLSTMLAAAAVPAWLVLRGTAPLAEAWMHPMLVFAAGMAVFVVVTHRSNLARMRAGTEDRKRSLMLFGRRR